MDQAVANLVRERGAQRCEYCRLRQDDAPFYRFQIEHVIPKQHGGGGDPANLALACQHCNLHKGTNLAGIDPHNGQIVPLFNPRPDNWEAHFEWRGIRVAGLTPAGRATVEVLQMSAAPRLELRAELLSRAAEMRRQECVEVPAKGKLHGVSRYAAAPLALRGREDSSEPRTLRNP